MSLYNFILTLLLNALKRVTKVYMGVSLPFLYFQNNVALQKLNRHETCS